METLKRNSEFERVRRAGRSWPAGVLILNAAPNGLETVRCGFIAGKKVGNAVKRNRARRLIREAIRPRLTRIKPGFDLVWIARASIVEADFHTVASAVEETLTRGKLWIEGQGKTESQQSRIIESTDAPREIEGASLYSQSKNTSE